MKIVVDTQYYRLRTADRQAEFDVPLRSNLIPAVYSTLVLPKELTELPLPCFAGQSPCA